MILRRVIEHVRNQEWTAIGIDFLIVVVGVFIGIQFSNWNAARADQVRIEVLLQDTAKDLRADIVELEGVLELTESRTESGDRPRPLATRSTNVVYTSSVVRSEGSNSRASSGTERSAMSAAARGLPFESA